MEPYSACQIAPPSLESGTLGSIRRRRAIMKTQGATEKLYGAAEDRQQSVEDEDNREKSYKKSGIL